MSTVPTYRVNVISVATGRQITLEVSPTHTLGELLKTVLESLGVHEGDYRLVLGFKEYGPQHYNKKLSELGIGNGDTLQLVPHNPGGFYYVVSQSKSRTTDP
jgi:uncharacterized ubiquitin-like protein YukD